MTVLDLPRRIECSHVGFNTLARLWDTMSSATEPLTVSLVPTSWFEGELSAVLGGMLKSAPAAAGFVGIEPPKEPVQSALRRNGFLCEFGAPPMRDGFGSSIRFRNLSLADSEQFQAIVRSEFLGKDVFPEVSDQLAKKISESVSELFSNSCLHSGSEKGVFICGQHFPNLEELKFTLYDSGVGIPRNVREFLNQELEDSRCIEWATISGNSTTAGRSGGLGLGVLQEFVDVNGGRLVIVSGTGYYQRANAGETFVTNLEFALPGTAVSILVRTDDTKSYVLAEEVGVDDIF